MGIVQTGIQNSDDHTAAIELDARSIGNAGVAGDEQGVLNHLGLSNLVGLTDHHIGVGTQSLASSLEVTGSDIDLEASQQSSIVDTGNGILQLLLVQVLQDLCLAGSHLCLDCSSLIAEECVVSEGHGLICLLICIVDVGHIFQHNDNRNDVIVFHGVGQFVSNLAIQVILVVDLQILVTGNEGRGITGGLCLRAQHRAQQKNRSNSNDQRRCYYLCNPFLLHGNSPFSYGFVHHTFRAILLVLSFYKKLSINASKIIYRLQKNTRANFVHTAILTRFFGVFIHIAFIFMVFSQFLPGVICKITNFIFFLYHL